MVNIINDVSISLIKGKTIAVIGYGAQGRAQALCMHDSGIDVVVGLRENGPSWQKAKDDGLKVATVSQAVQNADIIHVLIPDEVQQDVYEKEIQEYMSGNKTLSFSHGFNIVYKRIVPPENIDVIMVAPKAPGTEERKQYKQGFGVPALIAVHQDATGNAKKTAFAMAKACGFSRAGLLECTFEQETFEDLFGEQAVLCGGVAELIKAGFETLTEAGYPPEMAYFECLHEMKLIVDLIYEGGISRMYDVVSNTAEYGGRTQGRKIITDETKKAMKTMLTRVEDGSFAKEWMDEYKNGLPNLEKMRQEEKNHPIETVGREIRSMFRRKD
ncbi:ketol-acid reductoisomerase [Candidatus Woesearchaeota archaeon]|nr:ketol-acid reductoisomerase [Candidatus Woesearchaeota archaeon]